MTPAPNPPAPTLVYPDAVVAGARAMKGGIFRYTVDRAINSNGYVLIEDLTGQVVFEGSYHECDQHRNEIAFDAGLEAMRRQIETAPKDGTSIIANVPGFGMGPDGEFWDTAPPADRTPGDAA